MDGSALKKLLILILVLKITNTDAQNYTSIMLGNEQDLSTQPQGGICLMGGATEQDNAMRWFLERTDGGDVLVLRASGSDGYNDYFYNQLGVTLNSVETIIFHNQEASQDTYIHTKIAQAEAIWIAGGDQFDYVSFWRDTPIDSLINRAIQDRNVVIGGTSAGMAIMGSYYFTAQNGTINSQSALLNPFDNRVTIDSNQFIANHILSNVITDTHYDNPDRKGRHTAFLARILHDYDIIPYGIAADEYTAICIDENNMAIIFGEWPEFEDFAYFIKPNCGLENPNPEVLAANQPLSWQHSRQALQVYKVNGRPTGNSTFNLNDWQTGSGGAWEYWSVENGNLSTKIGGDGSCSTIVSLDEIKEELELYPNPVSDKLYWAGQHQFIGLTNLQGQRLQVALHQHDNYQFLDLSEFEPGLYLVKYLDGQKSITTKIIKK